MKPFFFLLLFICIGQQPAYCQRQDNNWIFGYTGTIPFESIQFNFDNTHRNLSYRPRLGGMAFAQAISDKNGKLAFYTNGCNIYNTSNQVMVNGDSINYNQIWKSMGIGYTLLNGFQLLPQPGSDSLFAFFSYTSGTYPQEDLRYNLIDPYFNHGEGKVLIKDSIILKRLFYDNMAVIQHGNGRDWWIICPKLGSDIYYKIKYSFGGQIEIDSQAVGKKWNKLVTTGATLFTPDGKTYVRVGSLTCQLMDFDRCTGELEFRSSFYFSRGASFSGAAISANSKYLYIPSTDSLFQFDLQNPDILSSRQLVGLYDGFVDPFPVDFFRACLAPDGKIYVSSTNGTHFLHIIQEPDKFDCKFEQRSLELEGYVGIFLPSYPNFKLYDLPDSPCDTLGINKPVEEELEQCLEMTIFPNPSKSTLFVDLDRSITVALPYSVVNVLGQVVSKGTFEPETKQPYEIDIRKLAVGTYYLVPQSVHCLKPLQFERAE
ncbi:MAG: T9SS type A sorting domain-containing protein [Saprospiraceae bacterium]